jgi:cyclic pyranopterin phosphate synthase
VDIGEKEITKREAVAEGSISMSPECFAAVVDGKTKKGAVLNTARIAGIMAAKRTPDIIPLCHTLNLSKVQVDFILEPETCEVQTVCTVRCAGKTGV